MRSPAFRKRLLAQTVEEHLRIKLRRFLEYLGVGLERDRQSVTSVSGSDVGKPRAVFPFSKRIVYSSPS